MPIWKKDVRVHDENSMTYIAVILLINQTEVSSQVVQLEMQDSLEEEKLMAEYHRRKLDDKIKAAARSRQNKQVTARACIF